MKSERRVLCGSSAYEQKYYFNEEFSRLPSKIKEELNILCVTFTEDVGGVFMLEFDEEGNLELNTSADDGDYLYDDIGSVLKIKQLQNHRSELFESLEMYYKVVFLGQDFKDAAKE